MYPSSVGGGDYSDSYTQIDKDTVLRLRGEMIPEMGVLVTVAIMGRWTGVQIIIVIIILFLSEVRL